MSVTKFLKIRSMKFNVYDGLQFEKSFVFNYDFQSTFLYRDIVIEVRFIIKFELVTRVCLYVRINLSNCYFLFFTAFSRMHLTLKTLPMTRSSLSQKSDDKYLVWRRDAIPVQSQSRHLSIKKTIAPFAVCIVLVR